MRISIFPLLNCLVLLSFFACQSTSTEVPSHTDSHSYARPWEAVVTHLDLNALVNFDRKVIIGTADLTITQNQGVDSLFLDSKDLTIQRIEHSKDGEQYEMGTYSLASPDPILGSKLAIPLNRDTRHVRISYVTDPSAAALQWLAPELTTGKQHPFLLTQSQAINARSWVPIQDGPGMRFTYEATVQVPKELLAIMSAENPTEKSVDGRYHFNMEQPIPAYLLALAVGDLEFAALGSRTGIYAEPDMLPKALTELEDTDQMMTLAEGLYGPYRWDRYDVVILPSSFPFGGMENPRLTFATPTILAGDKSLTALIAHELAHSWSGNLVTNATWDDFWLNEGFTVYFENRIMEGLKGRGYSEMLAQLSYQDLVEEVEEMGAESPSTQLAADLTNQHPDEGMSAIAYDKGYYFLRLIEETTGRDNFDEFLKAYFTENAFQTMTTDSFVLRLRTQLLSKNPEWESKIGVQEWVYGQGIPENIPVAASEKFLQVEQAIADFESSGEAVHIPAKTWSTHEWLHFIRNLPTNVTAAQLATLDQQFDLTHSTNAEIQCAWYTRTIGANYEPAYPAIREFLLSVGRLKFLAPLYSGMATTEAGKERAILIYTEARGNYHPISQKAIDEMLGKE